MQPIQALAPYAAILAVLMVVLSVRVSLARRRSGIVLGVGNDTELLERVRIFGNFAEFVPMALVLLAIAAMNGLPDFVLHGLGTLLVVARGLHPFGMSANRPRLLLRVLGMAGTYTVILLPAVWMLLQI